MMQGRTTPPGLQREPGQRVPTSPAMPEGRAVVGTDGAELMVQRPGTWSRPHIWERPSTGGGSVSVEPFAYPGSEGSQ